MYCKYCKVNVKGNINICPLCHEVLTNDHNMVDESLPVQVKPMRNPKALFSRIYIFIALNILIMFAIINSLWIHNQIWSLLVAISLIYIYFLVKITILSHKNPAMKIFSQAVFLSIISIFVQKYFYSTVEWCFTYAIPAIAMLAALMLGIFTFINIKESREFLLYYLGIAILGCTPIILVYVKHLPDLWPSTVSALTSIAIVLSLMFFASKDLIKEIKKKFHA